MNDELLISLAETKSLLQAWTKEDPKNLRWGSLLTSIAKLQAHLAPPADYIQEEFRSDDDS